MWKPANVVPEHKKRATVIWGALLLAIVGYTVWQIAKLCIRYRNPSTTFSVSDEEYLFPPLEICFIPGAGCDSNLGDGSECAATALYTVYDPCSNDYTELTLESEYVNCMALDLSSLDVEDFKQDVCDNSAGGISTNPSVIIHVGWFQSADPDNEGDHSEHVWVLLGNEDDSEVVTVPYSRVVTSAGTVLGDVTYVEAVMIISKSTRNYISGSSKISYPTTSLSTSNYVATNQTGSTITSGSDSYATGYLYLTITQGSYSLTELSDVNPFDVGSLLGNVGGFWEILLVVWGIFFIASRDQSSTEKGRDFSQPIERGKTIIGRKRRRTTTQTATTNPGVETDGNEQPYWSAAARGQQDAPDGSILVTPPLVGEGPAMDLDASVFRRPTPKDCPMRLVGNSSRSVMKADSFMANGNEEPTSPKAEAPSCAEYA